MSRLSVCKKIAMGESYLNMIHLSEVSQAYSGRWVLQKLNLELKQGDFFYLVGESGSGKSSLLKLLATREVPSQGIVSVLGYGVNQMKPSLLRTIRQALGYIPQEIELIPDWSVLDHLILSLRLAGKPSFALESRKRIQDLLGRLRLENKKKQAVLTLSRGEAQRVAVACALVRSPGLIIADEPTGSQDRANAWSILDLFVQANQLGATVVLATHDREMIRRVRKPCGVLKDGRLYREEGLCIY